MKFKFITGKDFESFHQQRECRHERKFEYKGQLYCENCNCVYDENLLEWVEVKK